MKICIYAEPLKVFTTSNPMRGWVKEFIKLRTEDTFIIALRGKPTLYKEYFDELESFSNVEIKYLSYSRKFANLLALLGFNFYNHLNINSDLCISAGETDYFHGFKGKTIAFLADLSSIRSSKYTSLKWHGKLIKKNALKLCVKHTDKIFCISNYTKNDLIDLYPGCEHKTELVYNGISDLWHDENYILTQNAEEFKKQNGEYFVWWGAITPRKNLINLLKAYKKVLPKGKIPKILIIGNVIFEDPEFEFLLNELKDFVKRLPFQDFKVLKAYIKESKGVLFPSVFEGFGLPIIEAYAMGKAVLHSNVTSMPEIAGGIGIEVNPNDIDSISEGIMQLNKENNKFAEERRKYASKFTYKNAADNISVLINSMYAK